MPDQKNATTLTEKEGGVVKAAFGLNIDDYFSLLFTSVTFLSGMT